MKSGRGVVLIKKARSLAAQFISDDKWETKLKMIERAVPDIEKCFDASKNYVTDDGRVSDVIMAIVQGSRAMARQYDMLAELDVNASKRFLSVHQERILAATKSLTNKKAEMIKACHRKEYFQVCTTQIMLRGCAIFYGAVIAMHIFAMPFVESSDFKAQLHQFWGIMINVVRAFGLYLTQEDKSYDTLEAQVGKLKTDAEMVFTSLSDPGDTGIAKLLSLKENSDLRDMLTKMNEAKSKLMKLLDDILEANPDEHLHLKLQDAHMIGVKCVKSGQEMFEAFEAYIA